MQTIKAMSETRVFFHIGMGKAGSSAIQKFLSDSRAKLADENFCFWRNIHTHHVLAHKWGGGWIPAGWAPKQGYDGLWRELHSAVDSSIATFIISSERFVAAACETAGVPEYIAGLFADLPVKILLYVRPAPELAESEYKQRILNGENLRFEDFISNLPRHFNYRGVVNQWASAFGADNVIVREYRRDGLVADFLSTIGSALLPPQSDDAVNPSISASTALEILRRRLNNRDQSDRAEIEMIRKELDGDRSTLLTAETRQLIEAAVARMPETAAYG